MTKTTIEIDENLTVRLSVYRHEKGLSSWMEAIRIFWMRRKNRLNPVPFPSFLGLKPNVRPPAIFKLYIMATRAKSAKTNLSAFCLNAETHMFAFIIRTVPKPIIFGVRII